MKGRIIGREGRNIRAFEAATGVDVIVDDTPEAVILSAFDQFRREVARISLERLIADGRIHPARIEELLRKLNWNWMKKFRKKGEYFNSVRFARSSYRTCKTYWTNEIPFKLRTESFTA